MGNSHIEHWSIFRSVLRICWACRLQLAKPTEQQPSDVAFLPCDHGQTLFSFLVSLLAFSPSMAISFKWFSRVVFDPFTGLVLFLLSNVARMLKVNKFVVVGTSDFSLIL